jgi:hypothetical protein
LIYLFIFYCFNLNTISYIKLDIAYRYPSIFQLWYSLPAQVS